MEDSRDAEVGLLSRQIKSPAPGVVAPKSKWSTAAAALLILIGVLAVIFTVSHDDSQQLGFLEREPDAVKTPLNVLVVGDWGRKGDYNQSTVADQMGKIGSEIDANFIISTGDNFYPNGLEGVDDVLFEESFSNIYKAPSLQKSWYAELGNHDYRSNPESQVDPVLTSRDSRWFCDYTYTLAFDLGPYIHGLRHEGAPSESASHVEFFFIDTNIFVESYWTPDNEKYEWRRSIPREEAIANQLQSLTDSLEASTATWKVVVGHHPMYSYGYHGNTVELIDKVLPIVKANNIDMYINGHDHCLQHIKRSDSGVHFVTSGGGSKAWRGTQPASNMADLKLYYDGQGFITVSVSPKILHVNFFDISRTIIHQIHLRK